jgi:hypothetical protein
VNPEPKDFDDYVSGGYDEIDCNWYNPLGAPGWTDDEWLFHQVMIYNGNVYDACIKIDRNNHPTNHSPDWMLGLDEIDYESLLGFYDNDATKEGDTELK